MKKPDSVPVALAFCDSYDEPRLSRVTHELLDKARLPVNSGDRVLVKPNLLTAKALACTSASLTASVCKWLLDKGCILELADSPGFGKAEKVASAIGLTECLKPLGLKVSTLRSARKIPLFVDNCPLSIKIAQAALECDYIFSVARIKAHSQLRMTICVKNCFGVVPGLHKAFLHSRHGESTQFFAKMLLAIFQSLKPVIAVADGIMAMEKTGPIHGFPFPLHLLGACANAPLLDYSLLKILGINPCEVPLTASHLPETAQLFKTATWPLARPEDFQIKNFEVPEHLKSASFNPCRLLRSCVKRIWKNIRA